MEYSKHLYSDRRTLFSRLTHLDSSGDTGERPILWDAIRAVSVHSYLYHIHPKAKSQQGSQFIVSTQKSPGQLHTFQLPLHTTHPSPDQISYGEVPQPAPQKDCFRFLALPQLRPQHQLNSPQAASGSAAPETLEPSLIRKEQSLQGFRPFIASPATSWTLYSSDRLGHDKCSV